MTFYFEATISDLLILGNHNHFSKHWNNQLGLGMLLQSKDALVRFRLNFDLRFRLGFLKLAHGQSRLSFDLRQFEGLHEMLDVEIRVIQDCCRAGLRCKFVLCPDLFES